MRAACALLFVESPLDHNGRRAGPDKEIQVKNSGQASLLMSLFNKPDSIKDYRQAGSSIGQAGAASPVPDLIHKHSCLAGIRKRGQLHD